MKNIIVKNKYIIGLVLVVLISLWQLSCFVYISKWDNIDAYLPYRYFVSDYLWHGSIPYWNPFQSLGVPVYSDLQSGAWYPITWLLILFGKYTINSLTIEIIGCYVIAALGFYKLSEFLYNDSRIGFILGLSYALCGFMVGSSQLLTFLIGIAWLPWIIYSSLSFFKTLKYKFAVLTALFIAICTSGASPPFTIVLVYSLSIMGLYFIWKNRVLKENIIRIFVGTGIIVVVSFLLLLPYINSFYEFLPYFNRAGRLPYERLGYNTFSLNDYMSFLFPFSVLSDSTLFEQTDVTLRNGYFGIIGLFYFGISLFSVRNKYFWALIICVLLSILLAAGINTPFYKIIYELPGLGLFKHTSFFRIYLIFSGLLLAGFAIQKKHLGEISGKIEKTGLLILIVLVIFTTIFAYLYSSAGEVRSILKNLFAAEEHFEKSLASHIFINGFVLSILLVIWYFLVRRINFYTSIIIIVILDLFVQTQLSAPKTIFNKIEHKKTAAFFTTLPDSIDQKSAQTPLKDLNETNGLKSMEGFWRNVSTYNQTLSCVGYNPMQFKAYVDAEINGHLEKILENPVMFFTEKEEGAINSTKISYNEFEAFIVNDTDRELGFSLNQNFHKNWKAYYKNEPLPVTNTNKVVMSVQIPPKSSGQIQFVFESPRTKYALIISLIGYFLVIGYLIKVRKTN